MKKYIFSFAVIICLVLSTACTSNKKNNGGKSSNLNKNEEAIKFKTEYENYNGKDNGSGKTIRSIELTRNNVFKYASAKEIIERMDNKESFIVYFGFPKCPWCRSVLPTLDSLSHEASIDKIYYVDVYDIRNTLEEKDGKVVETKKGSDGYYKLLDKLDVVLSDYELKDKDGKEIETKQKRIYAPNVVAVVDGEAKVLKTGISDKQTDAYMELSDEIIEDTKKDFNEIFDALKSGEKNSCDVHDKC